MSSSSLDLCPRYGGRFVLTRREGGGALAYDAHVYLAGGHVETTVLSWDSAGTACFDPPVADAFARLELEKLARPLRRTGEAKLVRWRGPSAET